MSLKIKNKSAFSVVEVFVVVIFLGILTWIVVPRFNSAVVSKNRVKATARKIVSDLRLARRLAISDAASNTQGFELKIVGSAPYQTYEIENADTKAMVVSHTLDSGLAINCPGGTSLIYGPLGNLKPTSATQLIVSGGGKSFTININSPTGTIKCTEY